MPSLENTEENIEKIILMNNSRGMGLLASELKHDFCHQSARNLLKIDRKTVLITTGFYVNGSAETDGPPGALFLATALENLGFTPVIVTDEYCRNYFSWDKNDIETVYVSLNKSENRSAAEAECISILETYRPGCLISIERCGRNAQGRYANMRGDDISAYTAPIDELFLLAKDAFTIGIGDGGNEIGMGLFYDLIMKELTITPTKICTSELIVSTTANWGAYGLIAYLEILSGMSLLPRYEQVADYLNYIVSIGAVDGISGKRHATVDGQKQETEKQVISMLHEEIDRSQRARTASPD